MHLTSAANNLRFQQAEGPRKARVKAIDFAAALDVATRPGLLDGLPRAVLK
jgi:hypothetical protein